LKLLVDENLAPRLASHLADLFPGSIHVSSVNLGSTADAVLWDYAKENGFAFLTKDKDFAILGIASDVPPKVILLQTGNCSSAAIEKIMRLNAIRVSDFETDLARNLLILK
jgi:predicted nuclease of predicted toxin-antitoxin system